MDQLEKTLLVKSIEPKNRSKKTAPESARFVEIHSSGLVKYLVFHKSGKFQIQKSGKCKKLKP